MTNTNQKNSNLARKRAYRGFSSSISNLLNDERVTCSAVACFGVLASMKTEYLLRQAHPIRGTARRERSQSVFVSIALLVTIVLFSLTYVLIPDHGYSSRVNMNNNNNMNNMNMNNNNRRRTRLYKYMDDKEQHHDHQTLQKLSKLSTKYRMLHQMYDCYYLYYHIYYNYFQNEYHRDSVSTTELFEHSRSSSSNSSYISMMNNRALEQEEDYDNNNDDANNEYDDNEYDDNNYDDFYMTMSWNEWSTGFKGK